MAQNPTVFQKLTRMFGFPGQTRPQDTPSFRFSKDELLKTDSREDYEKALSDDNNKTRQLATCLYFIDNLALRVGGSKDTKEEAEERAKGGPKNIKKADEMKLARRESEAKEHEEKVAHY